MRVCIAVQEASTRGGGEKRTAGEAKKGTQGQQEGVRRLLRDRAEMAKPRRKGLVSRGKPNGSEAKPLEASII